MNHCLAVRSPCSKSPIHKKIRSVTSRYVIAAHGGVLPFIDRSDRKSFLKEITLSDGKVTQDYIATCLAAEANGVPIEHPDKEHFYDLLYENIKMLIYKICRKYMPVFEDQMEDLVHDCMLKIVKEIKKFDAKRGSFSTWCYWRCRGVIIGKYRKAYRDSHREFVNIEDDAEKIPDESSGGLLLSIDFSQAIRDLVRLHPRKKRLIHIMLGRPDDQSRSSRIIVSRIARVAKISRHDVSYFYKNVVRPFFRRRFRLIS